MIDLSPTIESNLINDRKQGQANRMALPVVEFVKDRIEEERNSTMLWMTLGGKIASLFHGATIVSLEEEEKRE